MPMLTIITKSGDYVEADDRPGGSSAPDRDTFIANVLEAALRVELGEWPPHTHERRRRRG